MLHNLFVCSCTTALVCWLCALVLFPQQGFEKCFSLYFSRCSSHGGQNQRIASLPGTDLHCLPLFYFISADHQKLDREARICRLLKHPNIGEFSSKLQQQRKKRKFPLHHITSYKSFPNNLHVFSCLFKLKIHSFHNHHSTLI